MIAVPRGRQWQPRTRANGLLGPQLQPQSTMLGLHPVIHVLITWITTHLPTPEGWMAELAMLADLYEMKIHYIFRKELIRMHNNVYH